eukprot:TRINITY_DN17098_c0_g1_i3.p1 TRINITY_DN17098_c0_g1~~TRINITY_DN17098_c0_g1_i3.p1  ORF type:complete len:170 (-),score=21.31 TRINITY_DN17098_c0_g1_i3:97-606(-)
MFIRDRSCDFGAVHTRLASTPPSPTLSSSNTQRTRPQSAPRRNKVVYHEGAPYLVVAPKRHSFHQNPEQIAPNRYLRKDDGERTVHFRGDIGFAGPPTVHKTSSYSDEFSAPKSSKKGGDVGEKRAGIYNMNRTRNLVDHRGCLLYTSDAADEEDSVDLGGRRIIKKKK